MKLVKVEFYRMACAMRRVTDPPGAAETEYLDMLRYDLAFVPPGGGNVFVVAFPVLSSRGEGKTGGKPTIARWRSFMIGLTRITGENASALRADFSGNWVTAMHPRDADGRPDYGKLVKVTLSQVLAARNLFAAAQAAVV